jgi:hypothetical protein
MKTLKPNETVEFQWKKGKEVLKVTALVPHTINLENEMEKIHMTDGTVQTKYTGRKYLNLKFSCIETKIERDGDA